MGRYVAQVVTNATAERAFQVFTDPTRFPQWQGMVLGAHDATGPLNVAGSTVDIDHGPGLRRTMTVLAVEPGERVRYRQTGMGMDEVTTVRFDEVDGGTRVSLTAEVTIAMGPIGRLMDRLTRRLNQPELQGELDRFAEVAARPIPDSPTPWERVSLDCGAGFRTAVVLGVDDQVVHLTLAPGTAKDRQTDVRSDARSWLDDPLSLRPLDPSFGRLRSRIVPGQPALRLDGGLGVPHIALSIDAWGDASPASRDLPSRLTDAEEDMVWADELAEVESWRTARGPVLGRDVDSSIVPLVTYEAETGFGVAKVLRVDRQAVHTRLYSDRWPDPPDAVDPWGLRLDRFDDAIPGIGHMPMSRSAFSRLRPAFTRLAMVGPDELDGYRQWKDDEGGVFA